MIIYDHIWSFMINTIIYDHISSNMSIYEHDDHIWSYMIIYDHISSNMSIYEYRWSYMMIYDHLWSYTIIYAHISSNMTIYEHISIKVAAPIRCIRLKHVYACLWNRTIHSIHAARWNSRFSKDKTRNYDQLISPQRSFTEREVHSRYSKKHITTENGRPRNSSRSEPSFPKLGSLPCGYYHKSTPISTVQISAKTGGPTMATPSPSPAGGKALKPGTQAQELKPKQNTDSRTREAGGKGNTRLDLANVENSPDNYERALKTLT